MNQRPTPTTAAADPLPGPPRPPGAPRSPAAGVGGDAAPTGPESPPPVRCDKRFGVVDVNGFRLVDPTGPRCDAEAVTAFRAECPRGHSEVKTGCGPHADRMRGALATGTRALCSVCARRDGVRTNAVIREIPLAEVVSAAVADIVKADLGELLARRLWTEGEAPR